MYKRTAIVTGGARGIGAACVKDMLKCGLLKCAILDWDVELGKETVEKLNAEFGRDRVIFLKCDVSKRDQFEQAFKLVMEDFKYLDYLVNNAGVFDEDDWERVVDINVKGVANGMFLGMKYMEKNNQVNSGAILNVASILGITPLAGYPMYTASKHAVIGMTRAWGMPFHYNNTDIRVMAICPGITNTKMISDFVEDSKMDGLAERIHDIFHQEYLEPEDVSGAMVEILRKAPNGSIWICEGKNNIYEIEIPSHKDMKK